MAATMATTLIIVRSTLVLHGQALGTNLETIHHANGHGSVAGVAIAHEAEALTVIGFLVNEHFCRDDCPEGREQGA